ncbi:MAG: hypothetical protein KKB13_30055, partial [Chloroflexi bacterium]|nr:hypothetical protein [Chloroflexota bacterium]
MKDERVVLGCTLLALVARLIAVRSFTANLLDEVPPLCPAGHFDHRFSQSAFVNRKQGHLLIEKRTTGVTWRK